jgi:hypothetical protein
MRKRAPIPPKTKIAVKDDFTDDDGFLYYFEYYQLDYGFNIWLKKTTTEITDKEDLNTRILTGSIAVFVSEC